MPVVEPLDFVFQAYFEAWFAPSKAVQALENCGDWRNSTLAKYFGAVARVNQALLSQDLDGVVAEIAACDDLLRWYPDNKVPLCAKLYTLIAARNIAYNAGDPDTAQKYQDLALQAADALEDDREVFWVRVAPGYFLSAEKADRPSTSGKSGWERSRLVLTPCRMQRAAGCTERMQTAKRLSTCFPASLGRTTRTRCWQRHTCSPCLRRKSTKSSLPASNFPKSVTPALICGVALSKPGWLMGISGEPKKNRERSCGRSPTRSIATGNCFSCTYVVTSNVIGLSTNSKPTHSRLTRRISLLLSRWQNETFRKQRGTSPYAARRGDVSPTGTGGQRCFSRSLRVYADVTQFPADKVLQRSK